MWTVVSFAKVGEMQVVVATMVGDTIDEMQVGWFQVEAARARFE